MYKVSNDLFLKIFLTQRRIEVSTYCDDDVVYRWEFFDQSAGDIVEYYLMSPRIIEKYRDFKQDLENNCPLLKELV